MNYNHLSKEILEICDDFLEIPSVILYEKPFFDYLERKISLLGYNTERCGNEYLVVKGKNPKKIFSAHVDRHGVVRGENGTFEYAGFKFRRDMNLKFNREDMEFYQSAAQRHTREKIFSYDNISGEILDTYTTQRFNLDHKKKYVSYDLDKKPKENEIIFGFESSIKIKEDKFYGQIDNAISVAVLLYLLKTTNFQDNIIFTTKEEIGLSWKNVLDYMDKDNSNLKIITLDTTPYENFNNKEKGFLVLRKGDENGKFDLQIVEELEKILTENKIPIEYKNSAIGMTELGRISSESKGKYNGATLQIPTLNYHTTYETGTIESLQNYYLAIKLLSENKLNNL